jgi:hypothetical protein
MTVHNNKLFESTSIKTEFVIPEIQKVFGTPTIDEEPIELSHKAQSDLHNQQNKLTLELLEKAIVHVRQYDSLATATKLTAKAFHKCPSMYNKRLIVDANRSLKAAIKADAWAKSRRRKRHVDESTVRRNLDTFYEKVAEAVASIRLDLDKRSLNLFAKIKKQYESNLPLHLPADKKAVRRTAHIVAMCESTPSTKYKYKRLEGMLFLIEDATMLGINRNIFKKSTATTMSTLEKAVDLAKKLGKTVYEGIIARPSDNIDWYLIQDIGTNIKFASFADKLDVVENSEHDNLSYEGYIKKQADEQRTQQQLKTKKLQNIRASFADDNIALLDDLKLLRSQVDNLLFQRSEIAANFHGITNVTGDDSGIEINQIRRLYGKTQEYKQHLLHEGKTYAEALLLSFRQRVEAKSCYYDYLDISDELKALRGRIAFITEELENRKKAYAVKLGMVSTTKYIELDA